MQNTDAKMKEPTDFAVMDTMATTNKDIAFFPDILDMKAVKKGAQVRVGITNEAMQKIAHSFTRTGPRYVAMLVVLNYEEFEGCKAMLRAREPK